MPSTSRLEYDQHICKNHGSSREDCSGRPQLCFVGIHRTFRSLRVAHLSTSKRHRLLPSTHPGVTVGLGEAPRRCEVPCPIHFPLRSSSPHQMIRLIFRLASSCSLNALGGTKVAVCHIHSCRCEVVFLPLRRR